MEGDVLGKWNVSASRQDRQAGSCVCTEVTSNQPLQLSWRLKSCLQLSALFPHALEQIV